MPTMSKVSAVGTQNKPFILPDIKLLNIGKDTYSNHYIKIWLHTPFLVKVMCTFTEDSSIYLSEQYFSAQEAFQVSRFECSTVYSEFPRRYLAGISHSTCLYRAYKHPP